MNIERNPLAYTNQKGATLLVALVILLVMSVVGVASMSSSNLQARMASNERQQLMALYAAESGIRAAKLFLDNLKANQLSDFKQKGLGLYSSTTDSNESLPTPPVSVDLNFADFAVGSKWTDGNSVEVIEVANTLPGNVQNARYFIEYLGQERLGLTSPVDPTVPDESFRRRLYRIVAIGWGQDPQIYSIIQTSYRSAPSL